MCLEMIDFPDLSLVQVLVFPLAGFVTIWYFRFTPFTQTGLSMPEVFLRPF